MSYTQIYTNPPGIITSQGEAAACIMGIPFDSTHSFRPGCRFAPDYIREMFNNTEVFHPEMGVDLETIPIRDVGNMVHTVDPSNMIDMARKVTGEIIRDDTPMIILGGEHLITLGTYTAFSEDTALVVLDAHYDLRDEYAGGRLSHASFLRRIVDSRGGQNIIHAGARAFVAEELAFLRENHIRTITDDDIVQGRGAAMLQKFCASYDSIYVSVDMDVLDPAFCPGVGNPEACGLTSRDIISMVRAIPGSRLAGADIVELNPSYDTGAGGALAAKIISTIMAGWVACGGPDHA